MKLKTKLVSIEVNHELIEKYNLYLSDYKVLVDENNNLINETLYRISGIGGYNHKNKYNLILKYVENSYKGKLHLQSLWCIINEYGEEKYVHTDNDLNYPYLIKNSCIYLIRDKYYNVETGHFYGRSHKMMENDNIIILDINNLYEKELKPGIMKIDKLTGEFEYL